MSDIDDLVLGSLEYQEKVVQGILNDHEYAEQMADIISSKFFTKNYLKEIVDCTYDYKKKYNSYPSFGLLEDYICKKDITELIKGQMLSYIDKIKDRPLNGESDYIQDTSLDFCRKMIMKDGMVKALDALDDNKFDDIVKIVMDSAAKGAVKDCGHEYISGLQYRCEKSVRNTLQTPWPSMDRVFNGGWERKSLVTFMAPTGVGKTHALCCVSADAISKGYNAVYITLEIQEYKIGLRHDAFFSGVKINKIQDEHDVVKDKVLNSVRGKLFIKEYPVKGASVQTIRNYLNKLKSLYDFEPDVLVVDYAGLLKIPSTQQDKRIGLGEIYEDLRALAQEKNLVCITADQTNRKGVTADLITPEFMADSYDKAQVCDVIIGFSRSIEDQNVNQGKFYIAKSRFGGQGAIFRIGMNPSTVKIMVLDRIMSVEKIKEENEQNIIANLKRRASEISKR